MGKREVKRVGAMGMLKTEWSLTVVGSKRIEGSLPSLSSGSKWWGKMQRGMAKRIGLLTTKKEPVWMVAGMKVIFLDIDGVLHSADGESALFCSYQMKLLSQVVKQTGAEIVLSSNWRRSREGEYLYDTLHSFPPLIVLQATSFRPFPDGMSIVLGLKHVTSQLKRYGLKVSSVTPDLNGKDAITRTKEIHLWLKENPHVRYWLVLDDLDLKRGSVPFYRSITKAHVRTDPRRGLVKHQVQACVQMLNVCR